VGDVIQEQVIKYDILKTEKISEYSIKLYVNDVPLLDLVGEQELPFSAAEYEDRKRNGGELRDEDGPDFLAGDYMYMNPCDTLLPNRNLLDKPFRIGFQVPKWNPILKKSTLLYCSCGEPDCWLFMCKITEKDEVIIWSDFEQYHRDWTYDLGPFIFEKAQYLEQISIA